MFTSFSRYFYKFLKLLDFLLFFLLKRNLISKLKEYFAEDSFKKILINKKEVTFFSPNSLVDWRIDTFFSKEPETLDWIRKFDKKKDIIFWDIGANIGLYTIYAGLTHSNCKIVSFEPSSNNLRSLALNISMNKLENRVKIFTNPLSDENDKFLMMREDEFTEGSALNCFNEQYNHEGKYKEFNINYQLLGKNIDNIIKSKILEIPDYIKIDVDGIEHLILEGAGLFLKDKKIKSISVEVNENFRDQYERVLKILKINDFKFIQKKQNNELRLSNSTFSKTFNYIFEKV